MQPGSGVGGARWWEPGVIYQVYPRSFQDSNGDGTGDLPGIVERLDYLSWLGVDVIWLSPIFRSPMADFGYDVADYTDVDPVFGTLADLDRLVAEVHRRGLRLLLDFVPNHSSSQHPWFVESRSSRDNPRRDWYIWADPKPDGSPPNNWRSFFGGSAWSWDERTRQYYLHLFHESQPDLNWRNPAVRAAMLDVLRFWLERGIDGFRVDVIWLLAKDAELRDNPPNPAYVAGDRERHTLIPLHTEDLPEVHDYIDEIRRTIDAYGDRLLVGEIYLPVDRLVTYYGSSGRGGVHLPFNFQLVTLAWDARTLATAIAAYEAALPADGWPNWVIGNHDQPRIATRVGPAQARVAAMLLLTLRGTPTIYYGDELGMADTPIPPDRLVDPQRFDGPGRDPARTPMPWDATPTGGFTTGEPWLPFGPDRATVNVEAERDDPTSILTLHRALLALRRAEPALAVGSWSAIEASGSVLAYERRLGDRAFIVALNLGSEPAELDLPPNGPRTVVLRTGLGDAATEIPGDRLPLAADEGVILGPHASGTSASIS